MSILEKYTNAIDKKNESTMNELLHDEYKINRVVGSTYQAVSGAGKASMDELFEQTQKYLENI